MTQNINIYMPNGISFVIAGIAQLVECRIYDWMVERSEGCRFESCEGQPNLVCATCYVGRRGGTKSVLAIVQIIRCL